MKKNYIRPTMQVVIMQATNLICESLKSVGGNAGFNSKVSGGSGPARSRGFGDWDDDE